jgi:hypothetical protein
VRLKQRSATDAENFLAAISSDNSTETLSAAANAGQMNQRGVTNLPAWMLQESGGVAGEQVNRANARSPSPPPSNEIKVPPPKRPETDAFSNSHVHSQATAAGQSSAERSGDRVGERGISNLPAWMTQDGASAASGNEVSTAATESSAVCAPPPPLSEIKIPVPKTAAEAAVSFPLLSMAAKRDRMEEVNDSSAKRPRESTSAVVFQEVAMLLQDTEVGSTGEQQHLDAVLSKAMKSDHALRSVSCVECISAVFVLSCMSDAHTTLQAITAVLQVHRSLATAHLIRTLAVLRCHLFQFAAFIF